MDLCDHGSGIVVDGVIVGCSFCSGLETTRVDYQRPKLQAQRMTAPVDRDGQLAAAIAGGEVCERCLTPHKPIGCLCSRQEHHRDSIAAAADWLHRQVDDLTFGEKEAANVAISVSKRSARRAALVHEPVDVARPRGITVAADERLALMAEFGVKPGWYAPRVNEPTPLPI